MGDQVTPHPYRPLVVEVQVETLQQKHERLRRHWRMTLIMQNSPEAATAERAAWRALVDALNEGS